MKVYKKYWLAVLLGICLLPPNLSAETHALLMGIGSYQDDGNDLPGVMKDLDHARFIAHKLGVKDSDMTELRNKDLTLEGMKTAFGTLKDELHEGDSVFVYYSGHGARRKSSEGLCSESLVSYEENYLPDYELETALKTLTEKANKVIVFLDSCHSGGATKSRGLMKPKLVPKSLQGNCTAVANLGRTRNLTVTSSPLANNFVYIAAARDNEVAFASEEGSLATLGWRRCLEEGEADSDGSGGVSAAELQACAQQHINRQSKVLGDTPHNIDLTGNGGLILDLGTHKANKNFRVESSLVSTLQDIQRNGDARWEVKVDLARDSLRINQDALNFKVTSAKAGYVYVIMLGSDSHTFDVLFPNSRDSDNQIAAGQALDLPRSSWGLTPAGPAGRDHLLIVVTPKPRDFSALITAEAGPYHQIAATQDSVSALQGLSGVLNEHCATSTCEYGAALVNVLETQ